MIKWYQENALIPGINLHQLEHDEFDISLNIRIPVVETAVSWCDGDIPQLKAIKEALELFTDNRVIVKKQSAGSSETRQPCDLAAPFKIIRNLLPTHTVRDLPPE